MKKIIIATRGSKLALWQANHIADCLREKNPELTVDLLVIKTMGDKILDVPLAQIGGKGLFVKEIEEALLDGRADIAVHSMKDVPTEVPEGLIVNIHPKRAKPTDTLLSVLYKDLVSLPQNAVVGTSSLRRQAQLLAIRPDLKIVSLRGNLDTRLGKLLQGDFDAIVLATSGLERLGMTAPYAFELSPPDFLPAVAQGALGIEYRIEDTETYNLISFLNDDATYYQVQAERGFLTALDGGCQVPIAVSSILENDTLHLVGFVANIDGSNPIRKEMTGKKLDAFSVGEKLAKEVLDAGGKEILDSLYQK